MAKIGILSDSHGAAMTTARAAQRLAAAGAEILLHLGDVQTIEVIEALITPHPKTGEPIETHIVFGNVDHDVHAFAAYAFDLGLHVDHPCGTIEADGKTISFTHGDNNRLIQKQLSKGVDYLCHGHTHQRSDIKDRGTRVINPGALFRADVLTVALLDTKIDQLAYITVPKQRTGTTFKGRSHSSSANGRAAAS